MKRLPIRWSSTARADVSALVDYIAISSGSALVALRYVDRIQARCEKIGDAPRGGRPRDDLMPGLRTVPFEQSAVIAYVIEDNKVRITNVFYGGRDFEAILRDANNHTE
ncbi:type II toxin-antitoxin system RelE/ParE family toxin [Mesorhizobium sp. WSM2239]|uniref:Type II toxin-antitoxin system RelE/ParE family toxin n=2 Tax=unclassified Mesorhizobium TaxID=325217 RepID=A0AAU8D2B7_9HYPH